MLADIRCAGGRQVLEVRAAAGGSEASLFAAEIFEMYHKYCERRGWKFEVMSTSPSEAGSSSLPLPLPLPLSSLSLPPSVSL
jgi:hypothetical protein